MGGASSSFHVVRGCGASHRAEHELSPYGEPHGLVHLVEYGVVTVLIYLALRERQGNGAPVRAPAVVALVIAGTLGVIDGSIQAVLPNRFFDPVDIAFNLGAALIAIGAAAALQWARTRRNKKSRGAHNGSMCASKGAHMCRYGRPSGEGLSIQTLYFGGQSPRYW